MNNLKDYTGIDYEVEKLKLFTKDGRGTTDYGLFSGDNHLGTVKKDYYVLQNDVVHEILEQAISKINLDVELDKIRGKIFYNRQRNSIQIPLPDTFITFNRTKLKDSIQKYITVTNSFDGKSSVGFGLHNTMISCANSFHYVHKQIKSFVHSTNLERNINQFADNLVISINKDIELMKIYKELDEITMPAEDIEKYIFLTLGITDTTKELSNIMNNRYFNVKTAMRHEILTKGNSALGVFNGITYYYNHVVKASEQDLMYGTPHKRMNEALTDMIRTYKING